jgi:hypothetical protein
MNHVKLGIWAFSICAVSVGITIAVFLLLAVGNGIQMKDGYVMRGVIVTLSVGGFFGMVSGIISVLGTFFEKKKLGDFFDNKKKRG